MMKKQFLFSKRTSIMKMLPFGMIIASLIANAQVSSSYNFTSSSGTYIPITTGTVIGTPTDDEGVYSGLNIGFSFTYNGVSYTQFGINTNGWISLGASSPVSSYNAISAGVSNNVISALSYNLVLGFGFTASATNGSNVLTNVSSFSGAAVNDSITGNGISPGTIITAINQNAGTISLSQNATQIIYT